MNLKRRAVKLINFLVDPKRPLTQPFSDHAPLREVQEKALEWIAAGCVAVLVLDPDERTATVYRAEGDAHIYGGENEVELSDAVPGFSVTVAELFA